MKKIRQNEGNNLKSFHVIFRSIFHEGKVRAIVSEKLEIVISDPTFIPAITCFSTLIRP